MAQVWKAFHEAILINCEMESSLAPLYDGLIHIKKELDAVATKPSNAFNQSILRSLQEKLHELENKYCKCGKFVPSSWVEGQPLPKGQGILSTLLAVRLINDIF